MSDQPRALGFDQAVKNGLIVNDYNNKRVPPEFIATLQHKVWGKRRNLKLFFQDDDGGKYVLSVFWEKYAPKRMPDFDMSSPDIQPGMRFQITTEVNRNGNINFLEAHVL